MNERSRTENVVTNIWVGVLFQIISLILGFVSRTIFIRILGSEYLGLNSLFTNILTILSFAELGIGSAIVFSMYKPLAKKDIEKLKKIVNFFKRTYFKIGIIILIIGTLIVPLIPFIIAEVPKIQESIYLIYFLFLIDTSISYFFAYKTSLITADQKNYIVVTYTYLFRIVQIIVQLLVLHFTKSYLLYLILQILNTFLTNLYLSKKAEKMYPFVKDIKGVELEKSDRNNIFSNVKALFIYKFGSVILNGTDSIIISKMFGLMILGLYSNYYLLLNAIVLIVTQILNAFTSSIGNLIAKEESEKEKVVFNELFYFTVLIYGIIGICLYILFNNFVTLWLGNKYLLDEIVVFALVLHFYINGVQFSTYVFRNTAGMFRKFRYASILAVILNIGFSIYLGKVWGLSGVFFATSISRFLTAGIIDPYVVYKFVLKDDVKKYYIRYFLYFISILVTFTITYYVTSFIKTPNFLMFIVKGSVTLGLASLIFILLTFKTKEFKNVKISVSNFLKKKLKIS